MSEAKVLVPDQPWALGEDGRVSLEKTTDFTFRAGRSVPTGVQGSLPHFASSCNLFVLPGCTLHGLYRLSQMCFHVSPVFPEAQCVSKMGR